MAIHLISYDLNNPGQKYEKVHDAIKAASNGSWCHVLESTWLIDTQLTVTQVYNHVRASGMDAGDHILVVDVTSDSKMAWLPGNKVKWINEQWY